MVDLKNAGLGVIALLLCLGCSGGGEELLVTKDLQTTDSDAVFEDLGTVDDWVEDGMGPDVTLDVKPDDIPVEPEVDPDVPLPLAAFGEPCQEDGDCESTLCIAEQGLGICTESCTETCPDGWVCLNAPWTGVDVMFVCFPANVSNCQPCQDNAECIPEVEPFSVGDDYARCMSYGMEGYYCAPPCETDDDCSASYKCESWFDVDGESYKGCRHTSGVCDCSPYAVALEASTTCKLGNDVGTCLGQRVCSSDGLGECEGEYAESEICDGLDNDCNGDIDDELELGECSLTSDFGECFGPVVCVDGEEVCEAALPDEEICDNQDNNCDGEVDEGFTDDNDNGILDCLEEDTDDDGILDYDDNCPEDANSEQEDNDEDDLGDACDDDDDNDEWLDEDDCDPFDSDVFPEATEKCNGIDDNCDEQIDEGYPDSNNDGTADCMEDDSDGDAIFDYEDNCPETANPTQLDTDDDKLGDACDDDDDGDGFTDDNDCGPTDPDIYPDAQEFCDGIDTDCDGALDNGFPDDNNNGVADCLDPPPDEDEDGIIDDEDNCIFVFNPQQEDFDTDTLGDACDEDDDADGSLDVDDCEPYNPAVHQMAEEVCNGIDDNCNAQIDEEELGTVTCGFGLCEVTVPACENGLPVECVPLPAGVDEVCDNLDNDCDGSVDEDLGTETCGLGVCENTIDICADGQDQVCQPLDLATDEKCDGLDNNCNDAVDEELGTITCGLGECEHAIDLCKDGAIQFCDPLEGALDESCDNLDNDCDGEVDEDYVCELCTEQVFGDHLYRFCTNPQPWADASQMCQNFKMDLATTNNVEEDQWLFDTVLSIQDTNLWWNGLNDLAEEGTFVWSSGEPVEYTNWYENEPNDWGDEGEDCAGQTSHLKTFGWNDSVCSMAAPYICEDRDNDNDGTSDMLDDDDDNDSIPDLNDNCPFMANPEQVDYDEDGLGQPCDDDDDNDGTPDTEDCAPIDDTLVCYYVKIGDDITPITPVAGTSGPVPFYDLHSGASHTGLEEDAGVVLFLYRGTGGALSLFLQVDKPANAAGGGLNATVNGISEASVLVSDDANEVVKSNDGTFACVWKWATCCNDGGVIGGIDEAGGFEFDVTLKPGSGITNFFVKSNDTTSLTIPAGEMTISFHKLPAP
jgi:hypothetical protein